MLLLLLIVLFFSLVNPTNTYACVDDGDCASECNGEPNCIYNCVKTIDPITGKEVGNCDVQWFASCSHWSDWSYCVDSCQSRTCDTNLYEVETRSCLGGVCGAVGGPARPVKYCETAAERSPIPTGSCQPNNYGIFMNDFDVTQKCDRYENDQCVESHYPYIGSQWRCGITEVNPPYFTDHWVESGERLSEDGTCSAFIQRATPGQYFYAPVSGYYDFYAKGGRMMFMIDLNNNDTFDGMDTCNNINTMDHWMRLDPYCIPNTRPCYYACPLLGRCDPATSCSRGCGDCEEEEKCSYHATDNNTQYQSGYSWYTNYDPNDSQWWNHFRGDPALVGTDSANRECVLITSTKYVNDFTNIAWTTRYLTAGYHKIHIEGVRSSLKVRYPPGSPQREASGNVFINFSQVSTGCPLKSCSCSCGVPAAPTLNTPANNVSVPVVPSVNFVWNQMASSAWGSECSSPTSGRQYEICIARAASGQGDCLTGASHVVSLPSGNPAASYNYTFVNSEGVIYWKVRAVNGCGNPGAWSQERVFYFNTGPGIPTVIIPQPTATITPGGPSLSPSPVPSSVRPTSTPGGPTFTPVPTVVALPTVPPRVIPEVTGGVEYNQICDASFRGQTTKNVTFRVYANDADGGDDISYISLRYNGTYARTITKTGSELFIRGNTALAIFEVSFPVNYEATVDFEAYIADKSGGSTGWFPVRTMRIWNCEVVVTGSMYDISGVGDVCANGFSSDRLVGADANFQRVTFDAWSSTVNDRTYERTISNYGYTSSGLSPLVWGQSYTVWPNGNINGSVDYVRAQGSRTVCAGRSFHLNNNIINPYQSNATLRIDMGLLKYQDVWFASLGGGVAAAGTLYDPVPITCSSEADCINAISWTNSLMDDGLVSASDIQGLCPGCSMGNNKNTSIESNIIGTAYNYAYFYNEIFGHSGIGRTMTASSTVKMSELVASGGSGVVFVDSPRFEVDVNNSVSVGAYLMVVVNGDIVINNSVDNVQGIFVANNFISQVNNVSNNQLTVSGMIYVRNSIRFMRGFMTESENNSKPSVLVKYRPDFVFSIPAGIAKTLTNWRETAN